MNRSFKTVQLNAPNFPYVLETKLVRMNPGQSPNCQDLAEDDYEIQKKVILILTYDNPNDIET